MRPIPCRTQPSMMSGSDHCLRTVAVLSESSDGSGIDAVKGEKRSHPRGGELRIAEQTGGIGQPEYRGEMHDRARALLSADHREMRLMTVQPREEDDAGLVEARRRAEYVTRQRHRRREDLVKRLGIARGELGERSRSGRRDRVEDAE